MDRRILTTEQIQKLSKNKNVARCGAKSVRYTRSFKASALRQYNEEGMSAVGIFEEAGFDLNVIGIRNPNKLMHQWNGAFGAKKDDGSVRQAGAKTEITVKRIENRRETRTLKAKVAYLEAENAFLAKLRAKRAE